MQHFSVNYDPALILEAELLIKLLITGKPVPFSLGDFNTAYFITANCLLHPHYDCENIASLLRQNKINVDRVMMF